jgi:hypothetical protein
MELKGKFVKVYDQKSGEGKNGTWERLSFTMLAKDNRTFAFDVFGNLSSEVKSANNGDEVLVDFRIECREYQGKYFTSLKVNKFEIIERAKDSVKKSENDGLPF